MDRLLLFFVRHGIDQLGGGADGDLASLHGIDNNLVAFVGNVLGCDD